MQLSQVSFFSPEFADPTCLPEGSVGWVLRKQRAALFPEWLFGQWNGSTRVGRPAWPAYVLMTTLILASREGGGSRRAKVRRLRRDTSWRAACGLQIGAETPDEATFRRFEKYLQARDPRSGVSRELLFHEHVVRLALGAGVVGHNAMWGVDSTPMWCFGAVHGTFRLLGDGLRSLCRRWARIRGESLSQLSQDWGLPLLVAKSAKGAFRIDWKTPEARAQASEELVRSVLLTIKRIRRQVEEVPANKRKGLLRRCRALAKVVCDDIETDADGRLVVAHKVASDRQVSIFDLQARSSRKSKSHAYKGFKLHLLGEFNSGLIFSLCVTPANIGDGRVAHRLIRRAKALCDELHQVLGDTAYSSAELRVKARQLEGVNVLASPQPLPKTEGRFGTYRDFGLDFETGHATCPAGITVPLRTGAKWKYFMWPNSDCSACPLRDKCISAKTKKKTIRLAAFYEEIYQIRRQWEDPAIREQYRARAQCERLISEHVRRGCRHARSWGIKAATTQAYIAAVGVNLALLAKSLSASHEMAA